MSSILVVEDKDSMRQMLNKTLQAEGYQVETASSGQAALDKINRRKFDLVLTDLKLPDQEGLEVLSHIKDLDTEIQVIVMTAFGSIETAVDAMKKGAYDFVTKPFDTDQLLVQIKKALDNRRLTNENILLKGQLSAQDPINQIVGTSHKMKEVIALVEKVANSDTTVLLLGESGTGKELFARAIHNLSPRSEKPYIAINCAAIPRELLENELFGSEKGAFTGAYTRKMGKFELAENGTLFLDEIGDLDISLQAKILRVLQERQIERLGGNKIIDVNVRMIAASNIDLKEACEAKKFREDLYYRLSVFPIRIPPLRERREDIQTLAVHFVERFCREMNKPAKKLNQEAVTMLEKYHWPGNVRELENTIERAVILSEGKKILPAHLAIRIPTTAEIQLREGAGLREVGQQAQAEAERSMIVRVLNQTKGNKRKASHVLKIDYTTLFDKMKKYQIEF
ncbi:MAG: sigma-54 dependent transcriptional regulator [candidate division Zixibacteria bacterium]|nr:sigma-54 dependent transcriptional regulator [candidate division Zixibacteria bacterium]